MISTKVVISIVTDKLVLIGSFGKQHLGELLQTVVRVVGERQAGGKMPPLVYRKKSVVNPAIFSELERFSSDYNGFPARI